MFQEMHGKTVKCRKKRGGVGDIKMSHSVYDFECLASSALSITG